MSITFAFIGAQHPHLYNMVDLLTVAGATLCWFYDDDPAIQQQFTERYPQARLARSVAEILDDPAVQLVASAPIPNERAPLGVRVMLRGKDYLTAKPAFASLDQLAEVRRVQAETGCIYSVYFGERFSSPSTVQAAALVQAGAIGRVVQTTGFGPHRLLGHIPRPDWMFQPATYGGILNDLASHQMDQFLLFTGSTSAEIVAAQVGNAKFRQFPRFEDYGDLVVRSPQATGYVRVDWLTPAGLPTWGDVRLFLLGTEGTIEIRKNVDLAGREGKEHLFLVDATGTRHIDCFDVALPFGPQLVADVLNRTETAMSQAHCFLACELALTAQAQAARLPFG